MLKEALEYLKASWGPRTVTVHDNWIFSADDLSPVIPPTIVPFQVETLSGLIDVISHSAAELIVQVNSPAQVTVCEANLDMYNRRPVLAIARIPDRARFQFETFMPAEQFVIGLHSLFVPSEDLTYAIKVASNLQAEKVATSSDDGISQEVAISRSITLRGFETIRSRVRLAPFRTFDDVEQPTSDFILRLHNKREEEPPHCGLFLADGGAWRGSIMLQLGIYLEKELEEKSITRCTVIA